jgi:putative transposase
MKKSRFTEPQIIGILKQQESGMKVSDICREHGISPPTFYNWKGKYGGMDVSQLKRIKELEQELSQYKKMYAEESLANRVLRDVIEKKLWGLPESASWSVMRGQFMG